MQYSLVSIKSLGFQHYFTKSQSYINMQIFQSSMLTSSQYSKAVLGSSQGQKMLHTLMNNFSSSVLSVQQAQLQLTHQQLTVMVGRPKADKNHKSQVPNSVTDVFVLKHRQLQIKHTIDYIICAINMYTKKYI